MKETSYKKYLPLHNHLAALVQSSEDAIISVAMDGTIDFWNNGAQKVFGYLAKDIVGKSIDVLSPGRKDDYTSLFEKYINGEKLEHYETKRVKQDGTEIDVSFGVSPILNLKRELVGFSIIARDITSRTEYTRYTRSLIEASLDPLLTINNEGKITDVNEASVKVTGVSREELIGTDFSYYFTEPEKAQKSYQLVFKKEFVADYPLTIKHVNGKLTDVLYNATVYKDEKGMVVGVFAAARDVTRQKQSERALKESEEQISTLFRNAPDAVVVIDQDGVITRWNPRAEKIFGWTAEEVVGEHLHDIIIPVRFREAHIKGMKHFMTTKEGPILNKPLELSALKKDQTEFDVGLSISPTVLNGKHFFIGFVSDISYRKKAEEELKKNQAYTRSLIEASLDPLVTIGADGKITDVNEAAVKVSGVQKEQLISTDFSNYFTEPENARRAFHQVFEKGFVSNHPLTIKHKNGKLTDVLYNASVYKDDNGNVLGIFAAARDVTSQKKLEKEVADREKEFMRVAELERFRKLTVGRELKMIELKKEIEDLKNKLSFS